jgi:prephenate dehydratase
VKKEILKIGYLGIRGSYSYQASMDCFPDAAYAGYRKFEEVFGAVESGEVDRVLIPVENSIAGRVTEVYNCLPATKVSIIGEYLLPIRHCLMIPMGAVRGLVPPHVPEKDVLDWKHAPLTADERIAAYRGIREVQSHAQALMQCAGFLEKTVPGANTVPVEDTATAARALSQRDDGRIAAIGSRFAAELYNLAVLAEDIEDDPANTTRFLIFSREPVTDAIEGPALTSILFAIRHEPGSLLGALEAFAEEGISLTKLETYMLNQRRPRPTFYVDVGAAQNSPGMQRALQRFKAHCEEVRVLGSYPASSARGKMNGFLPVGDAEEATAGQPLTGERAVA